MADKITILNFTRDQIKAMAQGGVVNIKSTTYWDVCKALSDGKTIESVADDFKINFYTVRHIKRCKCP